MTRSNRRDIVKTMAVASAAASTGRALAGDPPPIGSTSIRFSDLPDRVFLGGDVWANPMEDWRIVGGRAECLTSKGQRNVQSIVHEVDPAAGGFEMAVTAVRVATGRFDSVGFGIGYQSDIMDHRANCFADPKCTAGVDGGQMVIGDKKVDAAIDYALPISLRVVADPIDADRFTITLTAMQNDRVVGVIQDNLPSDAIAGNVSLLPSMHQWENSRFAFGDWRIDGDGVGHRRERRFGPILWTMYTVDQNPIDRSHTLRLTAIMAPVGAGDRQTVDLQTRRTDAWQTAGSATIDRDSFTATFVVADWDASSRADYRVVYQTVDRDGQIIAPEIYPGVIRRDPAAGVEDPADTPPLRLAALTCQNDYAFPYAPVASNLKRLDPDLIYFSGDQIYEHHGGFGIIVEPADRATLNYLRKFYQFGWAFGESMAVSPTVCIPDDHDVFQGNIWGEGGRAMEDKTKGADDRGGYRQPAAMVRVVHQTCTSHHPPPYDPTPCHQGISVYYGTLLYGGVGFAILGDRQFKSGPQHVETGSGRADHVYDRDVDTSKLDKPGLHLLGERQETFLRHWTEDFAGHTMKVLLSQTLLANLATHHGQYDGYIKADLDSGGWPQTARDRAIEILRRGKVLHVNGDQHLTTMSQYGTEDWRTGPWSFCVPAIAVGYPRWWRPDEVGMSHTDRPIGDAAGGRDHTGKYRDGFGNRVYVHCHGNPIVPSGGNRYQVAHQKGSGLGLVTIDSAARTYRCEAFRFLCDAVAGRPEDQFPGWPVVVHQAENAGENRI